MGIEKVSSYLKKASILQKAYADANIKLETAKEGIKLISQLQKDADKIAKEIMQELGSENIGLDGNVVANDLSYGEPGVAYLVETDAKNILIQSNLNKVKKRVENFSKDYGVEIESLGKYKFQVIVTIKFLQHSYLNK